MGMIDRVNAKLNKLEDTLHNWDTLLAAGALKATVGTKLSKLNASISEIANSSDISPECEHALIRLSGLQSRFEEILQITTHDLISNAQALPLDDRYLRVLTIKNIVDACSLFSHDEVVNPNYRSVLGACEDYLNATELASELANSLVIDAPVPSAASSSSSSQPSRALSAAQRAQAVASSSSSAQASQFVLIKNEHVSTANYLYLVGKVVGQRTIKEHGVDVPYTVVTLLPNIPKAGELPNQRTTIHTSKTYALDSQQTVNLEDIFSRDDIAGFAAYLDDLEQIINAIDGQGDLHQQARIEQRCVVEGVDCFAELKARAAASEGTVEQVFTTCAQLAAFTTQMLAYAKQINQQSSSLDDLTILSNVLGEEPVNGDLNLLESLIIQPFLDKIDRRTNGLAEHLSLLNGCPQT